MCVYVCVHAFYCTGADGVNIGTRFMATIESPIHANIKAALVSSDENDTTLVLKSLRNTERVYKNDAAKKVQEIEKEHPGDINAIRHIVSGENYRKSFYERYEIDCFAIEYVHIYMHIYVTHLIQIHIHKTSLIYIHIHMYHYMTT